MIVRLPFSSVLTWITWF